MYAPNLPEPWMIAELEKVRRNRESRDERPALELPLAVAESSVRLERPRQHADRHRHRAVINRFSTRGEAP